MIESPNLNLTIPIDLQGQREKKTRLLIIGLDGPSLEHILEFIQEGKLPQFKHLIENGVFGEMSCSPPINSIAGWTTLITGTNIGRHGIYNYGTFVKKDKFVMSDARLRGISPFWKILSDSGKKVIVLNFPGTYPVDLKDGIQIAGAPFVPLHCDSYTQPKYLTKELSSYGYTSAFLTRSGDDYFKKLDEVYFLAQCFIRRTNWDCFAVCFVEPDKFHSEFGNSRNEMEKFYLRLDNVVKSLTEDADEDTRIIICSDHGVTHCTNLACIERWLYKKKLLYLKSSWDVLKENYKQQWLREDLLGNLSYLMYKTLKFFQFILSGLHISFMFPAQFRDWIEAREREIDFDPIDWDRTLAYRTRIDGSSSNSGGIRLNLTSENENNLKNYESLREKIINSLRKMTDPGTGQFIVKGIYKREEIYNGRLVNRLPDIIFILNDNYKLQRFNPSEDSIRNPNFIVRYDRPKHSHSTKGIFVLHGKDIKKNFKIKLSNLDIAPTLLHIMEGKVPSYMEGRVLTEVFEDLFIKEHPIEIAEYEQDLFCEGEFDLTKARVMEKPLKRELMKKIYKEN
jgi:predicted AlkP superfamily phosphohydrolase/phosphomutase